MWYRVVRLYLTLACLPHCDVVVCSVCCCGCTSYVVGVVCCGRRWSGSRCPSNRRIVRVGIVRVGWGGGWEWLGLALVLGGGLVHYPPNEHTIHGEFLRVGAGVGVVGVGGVAP